MSREPAHRGLGVVSRVVNRVGRSVMSHSRVGGRYGGNVVEYGGHGGDAG